MSGPNTDRIKGGAFEWESCVKLYGTRVASKQKLLMILDETCPGMDFTFFTTYLECDKTLHDTSTRANSEQLGNRPNSPDSKAWNLLQKGRDQLFRFAAS
jgi:hypothetical protein